MDQIRNAAEIAVRDCLAVKPEETVLVITDKDRRKIGYALFDSAREYGKEAFLVEMKAREFNGEEPPGAIAEFMKMVDVVICPTTKSLTHTDARRNACKTGTRVGTLPGITEDMMIRTMSADYHRIANLTYKITEILDRGEMAWLTTSLGTDIKIPIKDIKAISSTGLITSPGTFGNLPSGESYLMPAEGKTNGVFYVDGSLAGIGRIADKPVRIAVENGNAVEISGGVEAAKLNEMVNAIGDKARNLAELGVGTNYMAKVTGEILEDEKVSGTVHLALGNNVSMGGSVNVGFHVDGIILNPTLKIDDTILLENGRLLVE